MARKRTADAPVEPIRGDGWYKMTSGNWCYYQWGAYRGVWGPKCIRRASELPAEYAEDYADWLTRGYASRRIPGG